MTFPLQLRGSPLAVFFFRMQDLPYLNVGIRDIKAKWRPDSGVYGIRLAEKKSSALRDSAKIKVGVMGSKDRTRYPQVISS